MTLQSTEREFLEAFKSSYIDEIPEGVYGLGIDKEYPLISLILSSRRFPSFKEGVDERFRVQIAAGFFIPETRYISLKFSEKYLMSEIFKEMAICPTKKARRVLKLYRQSHQDRS